MMRGLMMARCRASLCMLVMLLPGLLGSTVPHAESQSAVTGDTPKPAETARHYLPERFAGRARTYYAVIWGVDSLRVKAVESGELIRFSYEIVDAAKASPLNDKALQPKLISPAAGVELVIPSLEKVGQLRQSSTPEAGRSYWMAFSNPRRTVKAGDRVNIVIGGFHAEGLLVE